jgi:putative FmdB family regulatory protein
MISRIGFRQAQIDSQQLWTNREDTVPLFDYLCLDCGQLREYLVRNTAERLKCTSCGGDRLRKMLAAPAAISSERSRRLPGAGDTACCGSNPAAAGCAGPGSCCGKNGSRGGV